MESDRRYYARRATEESRRAARALTAEARAWHRHLAEDFMKRAQAQDGEAESETEQAGQAAGSRRR